MVCLSKRLTEAAKKVADLEAANGRLRAALKTWAANLGLWFDDPKLMELADKMRDLAALSDAGEGWLEARRLILEAFDSLPGWPDDWYGDAGLCLMCAQDPHGDDCWVGKCERGLAALDALEVK